ncbi:MAG: hypothetical protein JWR03_823 [Cohnella sp.]|nr:hypothetical protein [Cohnella sp.]
MMDMIIKNGKVVDGSGAPWYRGDIAIKDGKIVSIGKLQHEQAEKVILADGLIVAPGFIDVHSHDDLYVLENRLLDAKVRQGITTTIIGNCGFGLYPVVPERQKLFDEYATSLFGQPENGHMGFASLDDFYHQLERNGAAVNVGSLVAHGVLRIAVMGFENRKPTDDEMDQMKSLLRRELRSGAIGMSLGLIYAPGTYADTDELIKLSKVVAEEGGIITSHMRNESFRLLESIEEMLTIAREADVPLEISHLKATGVPNFGKGKEALHLIAAAKQEGVDVTFDQYPYPAGSTTAIVLMPPWSLEGGVQQLLARIRQEDTRQRIKRDMTNGIEGSTWEMMWEMIGWDNIMICAVETQRNKDCEGNSVQEMAISRNQDPIDFVLDLVDQEDGRIITILFQQDQADLEAIMVHDLQMFGSDGLPLKGKKAHPRLYGTYPRVLGTYVRDNQLLTLERAIFKMTHLPANRLGLMDRGLLRPGMAADITIFNADKVEDRSTYAIPDTKPEGIEMVIVNGSVVLQHGQFTDQYPGVPLRRQ